ncbi:hypothetical protein ADL22_09760 [Streptomyces sp. NRRL F-4489]|uniref:hypothetical protein n=1 Tax=Streptomyces sp. NRRL F-4489 TaxID=1609095 RepID=UPI0007496A83|nr:hypothetical protein [Streptomyces sp. NRRL F-4489]KUL47863.1 hypothetical protein ADL22_09760 [Streptomyces sp. NRRL F-4489]
MTTPTARTPYAACAEEGAEFDDALKKIGIKADPSTVKLTEYEGGLRLYRIAPPLLTPSQARLLTRIVKAARMSGAPDDVSRKNSEKNQQSSHGKNGGKRTDGQGRPCTAC